jgi:hypothetical protein
MGQQLEIRVTQVMVGKPGETVLDQEATTVLIEDEGAGEFVTVRQETPNGFEEVRIDPGEWPVLRRAINKMVKGCRK